MNTLFARALSIFLTITCGLASAKDFGRGSRMDPELFQSILVASALQSEDEEVRTAVRLLAGKGFLKGACFEALRPYLRSSCGLDMNQLEKIAVSWIERRDGKRSITDSRIEGERCYVVFHTPPDGYYNPNHYTQLVLDLQGNILDRQERKTGKVGLP